MEISTFTDEYELAAPLYGVTPERLREIDGLHGEARPRWLAADTGGPVGVVTSHIRADGRLFGHFGGDRPRTAGPLTAAVAASLRRELHVSADEQDAPAFLDAGFRPLRAEDRFRVGFATALDRLGDRPLPHGCALRTADDASLVAVDDATGEHLGLARFRHDTDGSHLDRLAVPPAHRGRGLGAALLAAAMRTAAKWDDAFTVTSGAEDARAWLTRLGGVRTGRDVELVRARLALEPVAERHRHGYVAMIEECDRDGEGYPWNNAPLARKDFTAFTAELADEAKGIGLPDGVAPQQTFVLVEDGAEVLGEFRLRPVISEPYEEHNGHVGYNLRPSARGRGYGTRGLALLLDEARRLGVPGVLVPVEGDNAASARVIEKNGGRVIRSFDGARSFWIDL